MKTLYVALGDSTGVGVGAEDGRGYVVRLYERMRARTPALRLLNLCVSGATAPDAAASQLPRALAAKPSIVTVFIGTNDALWGRLDAFTRATAAISSALGVHEIPTALATLPNLAHAPLANSPHLRPQRAALERKLLTFNDHLRALAARDGHTLVDLFEVGLADFPHYFSMDGFHPSSDGYAALAERMWERIESLYAASAAR
jgi:acyl-CoA thioesterase-1